MQRREHVTTTGPRRGVGAVVITRTLTAVVAFAVIAIACDDNESAGSESTIETSAPVVASDVVYNEHSTRQVLDVHVPGGDGPFPTILAIHGGGFSAGSKMDYERHADHFVASGIAFVPINYRFAPSATHPAQVEDVHCALAWVHEHADRYRFDRSRVVVMGASAGAYLAGMLATADDRERYVTDCPYDLPADPLAGAVPMYGMFDLTALDDDDYPPGLIASASRLAGEPYNELDSDVLAEMSPIEQIDGSEPPILAIHGTLDRTIPSVMSERFVAALEMAGADAELLLVEGPHAFDIVQPFEMSPNGEVLAAIERFVDDVG